MVVEHIAYKVYHVAYIYDRDFPLGEIWKDALTLFTDQEDITVCVVKEYRNKKPSYANEGIRICW